MGGLEIALLIFGLILIGISFVLVDKKEKVEQPTVAVPDMKQLNVISERAIKDMNTNANKLIESTEDSLEAISNDKIMAVNEYSDQVLNKIDANHKEVVFLYQMLQDKENELKETAQRMEALRIGCEQILHENGDVEVKGAASKNYFSALDELSSANSEQKSVDDRPARILDIGMEDFSFDDEDAGEAEPEPKNQKNVKSKDRAKQRLTTVSSDVKQNMIKNAPEKSEKTNEVIALYKKKKSVMEISKLLNMGQGEVKLIIELYCK
ncbi:MAG: hypothetical protein IKP88_00165 [Lachnospiraceae bacterium]|nr:hypothetical protein [Lachnospiraceae bacterium]